MTYDKCQCGGEMQLESFDHSKRQAEWFMRCRECKAMSQPAATPDEAQALWNDARAA